MHTSELRGSDFKITVDGGSVSHDETFGTLALSDRLGILAGSAFHGLGAAALTLAHVTAFYNRYRETGDSFFAYPDFFSFQDQLPVVNYGMLDIWPAEKNVALPSDPWDALSTIASRAITTLVVPEKTDRLSLEPASNREKAILESLRRTVRTCYTYSPDGQTAVGDMTICCTNESVREWGDQIIERGPAEHRSDGERLWNQQFVEGNLTQSYTRADLKGILGLTD